MLAGSSSAMNVGDKCVVYYDINNPNFVVSQSAAEEYAKSIEYIGCAILFSIACAYMGYTIEKCKQSGESLEKGLEKGLLAVVVVIVITFIIVIKESL